MNRITFLFLMLSLTAFTSCEKIGEGWIVDWTPVSILIRVTDGDGADLLDPANPDNMIDGTTITFKGETYEASRQWYETGKPYEMPATKAILARLYGLFLVNSETAGFSLYFGEIDGAEDMDEYLVVTLPDGNAGTIHYHCSKHNERKVSCDRRWKFNGKKHDGNIFTFVVSN